MKSKLLFFLCLFALISFLAVAQDSSTSSTGDQQPTGQEGTTTSDANQNQDEEEATQTGTTETEQGSVGTTEDRDDPTTGTGVPDQSDTTGTQTEHAAEGHTGATGAAGEIDEAAGTETETGTQPTTRRGTTRTETPETATTSGQVGVSPSGTQAPATDAPKLEVTKRGNAVATLRGSGDQETKTFNLAAGPATFEAQLSWEKLDTNLSQNEGKFSVHLLSADGQYVDMPIGTIDYFNGANTINIPQAGSYKLKVTAPGSWSVRVEQ